MFHQGQATDYIDLLTQLEDLVANSFVDVIAINVAGTGWAVGDLFDINGGTIVGGHNATGEILAEAGGIPSSIRIFSGGAYTASPGVAATTTALGISTGINLTIDATIAVVGWSVDRSAIYATPERELLLRGIGSGSDEIYVDIQTQRDIASSTFYWRLAGATGFDNGELWEDQPGTSQNTAETINTITPFNNGTIDFWLFADSFHIKLVGKSGSSYTNLYLGFLNQYATPAEYPYPLMILGCSSLNNIPYNNSSVFLSGMTDPRGFSSATRGTGALREVDGNWYEIQNGYSQSLSVVSRAERVIWPVREILGTTPPVLPEDEFAGSGGVSQDLETIFGGDTLSPTALLNPTPDSGGDIQFLWPTVIYQYVPTLVFLGELMDVHPVSVFGIGAVSEDTFTDANGDVFIIFQNCNRTDTWAHFALKRTF